MWVNKELGKRLVASLALAIGTFIMFLVLLSALDMRSLAFDMVSPKGSLLVLVLSLLWYPIARRRLT